MRRVTLKPNVSVASAVCSIWASIKPQLEMLEAKIMDLRWDIACKIGATVTSFSLEYYWTQEHRFSWEDFRKRYTNTYGALVC